MYRIARRLARLRSQRGFSLAEVLVGGLVLVVGMVFIAQFFASAASRVLDSDIRSVLHQVATEDLETIRGMPYPDVGTTDGHPEGTLAPDEDRVVQNVTIHIHRDVIYWTDDSYEGPYPANYRRVTVTVSAVGRQGIQPVELVSNVAGGAEGGTLDITVTDVTGDPVEGAAIRITNTNLVPNVDIHSAALKTNNLGRMIVPGLEPDPTPSYVVTVSKSGYNTDFTDPAVVVLEGLPYTVVQLTIDLLSDMVVKVQDTAGTPIEGLELSVIGPEGFSEAIVSAASGVTLSDLRYSTDSEPYIVRLLPNQGYDAQEIKVVLAPGTTQEVIVTVPVGGPTTTTTAAPTTTTVPATTTTTAPTTTTTVKHSLRVTVLNAWGWAVGDAWVTLNTGQSQRTGSGGWVFFDNLGSMTYGVTVTAYHYQRYETTVAVNGATTLTVYLSWGW